MNPARLVRFLDGLQAWLAARREFDHKKWLRENGRVVYTWPSTRRGLREVHHSARRNGTEAVT